MLECGCRLVKLRLALPHRRTHTLTPATADDDKDKDLQGFDIDKIIDKDNFINIDMAILENIDIDIDKGILQNIDIDKISYRLGFGISNTPIVR